MVEEKLDLWSTIMASDRVHMNVPFPGTLNPATGEEYEVAMVVLTAEESSVIQTETERKIRKLLKEDMPGLGDAKKGYDELYSTLTAAGLLYTVVRNPNNIKEHLFPNKEAVLKLSNDQLGILINHYYTICDKLNPVISDLTEDEMEVWLKRLQEAGSKPAFFLNTCTSGVLKTLVTHLASQLKSLQTSSNSYTSPQEEVTETL